MLSILLNESAKKLEHITDSPRLEAELLLGSILNKPRSYLYAYPDIIVAEDQCIRFNDLIVERQTGKPIAYILGIKDFWNFELIVNEHTLIPRPETELLIEIILHKYSDTQSLTIADLGTGSGAIAIALAKEQPNWKIIAVDYDKQTLEIAKKNADKYQCNNIEFIQSHWFENLQDFKFDGIVSNPPYIADGDACLEAMVSKFEPRSALIASAQGLADISQIITQGVKYLAKGGFMLLEHGYSQKQSVQQLLQKQNFSEIETFKDLASHDRATFSLRL